MIRNAALTLVILALAGCAAEHTRLPISLQTEPTACLQFYQDLDRTVYTNHVEDSGEVRVIGFPYLRSNRFLASFRSESLSEQAYEQWLEQLRQLDEQARALEFANLPPDEAAKISDGLPDGASFQQRLQTCGRLLVKSSLIKGPQGRAEILAATAVPDDYQTWKRVLGAYPLAAWLAEVSLEKLHRELNKPFQMPAGQIPVSGKLISYQPYHLTMLTKQDIGRMLGGAYQNPLSIRPFCSSLGDRHEQFSGFDWVRDIGSFRQPGDRYQKTHGLCQAGLYPFSR